MLLEEEISYLTDIEYVNPSDSSAELAQFLRAPCANEYKRMK